MQRSWLPLRRFLFLTAAGVAAAATVGLPAHAAPATGRIEGAGAAGAIPGRYIVVLKPGTAQVGTVSADLTARYGGTVQQRYEASIHGFSAAMSEAQARRLAADASVALVEQDQTVKVSDDPTGLPSWGLDRIDQRDLPLSWSYSGASTAAEVHAYIIDSGIRTTHVEFGGRARNAWDFADATPAADNDCNGHGTHVAATVGGSRYGVAKGVHLVGVRVMDCDGRGTKSDIIAGVDWVTAHAAKPAVANMSIGGTLSAAEDVAVQASIASGVTYVVAAGNDNTNACRYSPSDIPEAITVGATDARDRRANFSNYGSCVDLFAPGTDIVSAYRTSDTATETLSGTSMAAPHVTGAAAMVLAAHPAYTPQQVSHSLTATAKAGKVTDSGAGTPNKLLYAPKGRSVNPDRPVVTSSTLTDATVGHPYLDVLTTTDPLAGTWSITGGKLPAGLALADGLVTGTPRSAGTATFTVRYTDSVWYATTHEVTLTVRPEPAPVAADPALPITGPATTTTVATGLDFVTAGAILTIVAYGRRGRRRRRAVSAG